MLAMTKRTCHRETSQGTSGRRIASIRSVEATAAMSERSSSPLVGRLAGLAYLGIIVLSIFGYTTVTRLLDGHPSDALAHIAASHPLFASAYAANILGLVAWLAVGLLLYRLMGAAGRTAGSLLLLCVAGGVAMNAYAFFQLWPIVKSTAVDVASGASMMNAYRRDLLLAQFFSGLWLFPFGWLIVRSRVAPSFLGVCLFVGGFGYVLLFTTAFVPGLDRMLAYRIVSGALGVPAMIGEFGICVWLLLKGSVPVSAPLPLPVGV